jgi:hypothetical protein
MYELYLDPNILLSEDGSYRPLCPVADEYVAGEIVNRWSHREQARKLKDHHESEMLEFDATLSELLFRMKQKLSRLGRNGGWSLWLRQQKIQRSTADRLVAQYAESYGLTDELRHREIIEPLQGNVCLAASRVSKGLKNMLKSPISRMNFIKVLADKFGLCVEWEGEGVRLRIPPPIDADNPADCVVPPIIEVQDDGTIRPFNYELKEAEEEDGSAI